MGCANSNSSLQKPVVFSSEYELGEKLCSGAFGQVYACQHRSSSAPLADNVDKAVKVIDIENAEQLRAFRKEESIWRMLCGDIAHPNCLRLMGSYVEGQSAYMVMERCQKSLKDFVDELDGAAFPKLARTVQEMLMAVAHVHGMGFMHRDLKLHNFLQSWDYNSVKLCDFGLATEMPKKGFLNVQCGSPSYVAPEVLRGKGYDEKADIWSLGVVAYVLTFGELPYKPLYHGVEQAILSGKPKPSFRSRRKSCRTSIEILEIGDLVRMLLDRSPEKRCSAENALQLLPALAQVGTGAKTCEDLLDYPDVNPSRQITAETISTYDCGSHQRQISPGAESFFTCDDENCYRQLSPGAESFSTYDGGTCQRQISTGAQSFLTCDGEGCQRQISLVSVAETIESV